jgi:hypothetical protein
VNEYSAIKETHLKDLSNPESACLENFLDVSRNGGWRWNDDLAVEISKDLNGTSFLGDHHQQLLVHGLAAFS